ncbi:hypothetical protein V8F20_011325 [Naviculisporaceae sp. PSN 640]
MPRRTLDPEEQMTLRLKHGRHTIFLFVTSDTTFAQISTELLEILQDRYPGGLTSSIVPLKETAVPAAGTPEAESLRIAYGIARDPSDPTRGWKSLKANYTDTVSEKRLEDGSALAFALVPDGDSVDMDDIAFDVELMTIDDEVIV